MATITYFPYTRRFFAFLWSRLSSIVLTIGLAVENTAVMARFALKGRLSLGEWISQSSFIGVDTLGIALILTSFSGMVISLQVSREMARQGAVNYIGALVSMTLVRELGPIMTTVAVIAMAGSAFAAELSTMQITRQVDALKVLHVSPIRYLILPRVIAAIWVLPLMTVVTTFAGVMGGMLVSMLLVDVHPGVYFDSVWHQTHLKDVTALLTKSFVFGYLVSILSTTIGLNTSGGAKEVGRATTRAVVWSFLACAIFDYVLTYVFYGSR